MRRFVLGGPISMASVPSPVTGGAYKGKLIGLGPGVESRDVAGWRLFAGRPREGESEPAEARLDD
jgi:hypothetical protein